MGRNLRSLSLVSLLLPIFCLTACCLGLSQTTRADSIATLSLNASFIPGDTFPASGPSLFVTGQFTVDEDTQTVLSWNMSFQQPLGAVFQLSPQNGGVATADCDFGGLPCPYPSPIPFTTNPGWIFTFGNGSASLSMDTLFGSATPFQVGETLQLCPEEVTNYPGGLQALSPACSFTSNAMLNGQTHVIYELASNTSSSGILTVTSVVSTPEPPVLPLLSFGGVFTCVAMLRRASRLLMRSRHT